MELKLFKVYVIFLTSVIASGAQFSEFNGKLSEMTDKVVSSDLVAGSADTFSTFLSKVDDPDRDRNILELITSKGYPCENHVVRTQDGYILNVQRIPHGCKGPGGGGSKKEVVFLAHGLLATADSFLIMERHQSLGFILADAGYDVWLGNYRGTRYSFGHAKYSQKDQAFWDFGFDQLAAYDTPAMINYILKVTKCGQVSVVAESLGTTATFALLAESPEFNRKIKILIAMSPVTYNSHMLLTSRSMCLYLKEYDKSAGPQAMVTDSKLGEMMKQVACNTLLRGFTCEPMFAFVGAKPYFLNKTRLGTFMTHFPTVTSTRVLAHYGQNIASKAFRKFDYGEKKNRAIYHQADPPSYDLSRVSTRVALLWSAGDTLAAPEDVALLRKDLRNVVLDYRVPDDRFEHLDFAIGTKACEWVYPKVLECLRAVAKTPGRRRKV